MLPDFTKATEGMKIHLNEFFKKRIKVHNPSFRDISVRLIHEGTGTTTINAENNFNHQMDLQAFQASTTITHDELINNPEKVYEMLDELAKQMAEQEARMMFEAVSEVTEKTGQITKRKGEVTPEVLFEMFGNMLISFNKKGQPEMPAIHAGPHLIPEIKAAMAKIQNISEYKQQFDALILRKKREWYDRESNRKLVG